MLTRLTNLFIKKQSTIDGHGNYIKIKLMYKINYRVRLSDDGIIGKPTLV